MPIFKYNSYGSIGVKVPEFTRRRIQGDGVIKGIPERMTLDAANEIIDKEILPRLELVPSTSEWGLFIKKFKISDNFDWESIGWTKPKNDIYFTCICWDYSGNPPQVYPPSVMNPESVITPLVKQQEGVYLPNGINIWPSRKVVGALNCNFIMFESDKDYREIGEQIIRMRDYVNNSRLMEIITAISANPQVVCGTHIANAVKEMTDHICQTLKTTNNQPVEVFQAAYGTDKERTTKHERHTQKNTEIEIELVV